MEEFDKLWKEFDESETDKHHCGKMNLIGRLLPLVEGDKKEKIELELKVVYLIFALRWILSHIQEIKVAEIDSYLKQYFPSATDKQIDYFNSRFKETKATQNKWRYAFVCFLLKRRPEFAKNTIMYLLESTKIHFKDNELLDAVHFLVNAFNINKLFNLNFGEEISKTCLKVIFDLENTGNERYMIEPLEIFCLINEKADKETIDKLFTIIHRAAHRFAEKENSHLQQSLLKASLELCNLIDLHSEEKQRLRNEIQLMVAKSHESDGDKAFNENNGLVASRWYEDAQKIYRKLGMSEKVKVLGEKIREASKRIEWKEISAPIKLPQIEFKGNTGFELVKSISTFREMIPNQSRIEQTAKEIMKNYPVSFIVPRTHYGRKNPIAHDNDDESQLSSEIKRQTLQNIKLGESWFSNAVRELEEQKRIADKDFIDFISSFGLHDNDSLEFIKRGIKYHFSQDYVASIHILIPQVENTLRLMLNSKGVSTIKVEGKDMTIMDSQMGGILENESVIKELGTDFSKFLKIKFTDVEGINLRNDVAHGLLPLSEFNHMTSFSLIQVLLILTSMSITNRKQKN